MSVTVGYVLLDGVFMAADTRATYSDGSGDYADWVQKVIPLTEHTVVGFVGNIDIAGALLKKAKDEVDSKRKDADSLARWLPRLFRLEFSKQPKNIPKDRRGVQFMVGSVIPDRSTILPPERIEKIRKQLRQDRVRPIKPLSLVLESAGPGGHSRPASVSSV
jgi:hypothetical protein